MSNFTIINNDSGKIPVQNPLFETITLNAGGAVDYDAGTVLAFDATAEKWKLTESGTAAVANAKAVLAADVSFSGAGDKSVRALIGGEVVASKLIFDGSDTLDTLPAGGADTFRIQLRDYGIVAVPDSVVDELDNQ